MRTLSSLTQEESQRTGQDVVWIFSVAWPDATVHYATRRVVLGDVTPAATLLEAGRLSTAGGRSAGPSGELDESRLRTSLALDGAESPSVRERLGDADPEGLEVSWKVLFKDAAGAARLGDAATLFYGVVERATVRRSRVELECVDYLSARGRKLFGRTLGGADLPETPSVSEGIMLPWIFGALDTVELLEWRAGRELLLAGEVKPDDTTIALHSVEGLPSSGAVQVGDERLEYDAIDAANVRLGTAPLPLRRTEPAHHPAGSSARLIPDQGFEWLVADHPCRSVAQLRGDGLSVAETDYATATESWRGRVVQKVVAAKAPTQVLYQPNVSTVRFNGGTAPSCWALLEGSAINPDRAIDAQGDETAAELATGAKLLAIQWRGDLKRGAQRYGALETVRLRLRVAASALWEPTTTLSLTFAKGGVEIAANLPRPDPGTELFSLLIPGGENSPDERVPLPYGPVDFTLDASEAVALAGGWEFLDGLGDAGFEVRVERATEGDPVRFYVSDVELEVGYRARSQAKMARTLTAAVEGVESDGLLLDNPADLVKFFLTDSAGLGLPAERIDAASFSAAANQLAALGYRFSNRLATPQSVRDVLARLLFESRCRLVASGDGFALRFDEGDSPLRTADFAFDGANLLRAERLAFERDRDGELLRSASLHHGRDFSGAQASAAYRRYLLRDSLSQRAAYASAAVDLIDRLHWHNHGEAKPVADLARALLGRHGFRREEAEIDAPLSAVALDPFDTVSLDDTWFPLALDQGEVRTVGVAEPHCLRIRTRFAVAGEVCWRYDAATFLRHRGSGRILEFWVGGEMVAAIQWDGHWRLQGEATENVTFYTTLGTFIEYNPSHDRVYFGTGAAAPFTPRFAVDGAGNLWIAGHLEENHPRPDVALAACNSADSSRLAIGIEETTPVLVFDAASQTLQLRGAASENERFY